MSFFGNLLKIVAIGAFFIATGPFNLPVGATLATVLRIGGVVLGYLANAIDRAKTSLERQTYSMTGDPGAPVPVVYGTAKVGSIVTDWFIDPDTDTKILYQIVSFCHGSRDGFGIGGYDALWLDNRLAVTNPTSGELVESGGLNVREHPYGLLSVDYKVFTGTTTQNVGNTDLSGLFAAAGTKSPSDVTGSDWSATTDTGKGIACAVCRFANLVMFGVLEDGGIDPTVRKPAFRGPPPIAAVVRGNFVEDPRSTVSGVNVTFANANPDTITRASGSFVTDDWHVGDRVLVTGSTSNNGTFTIATVAATVLTLVTGDALAAEGPVAGVTLTRWASPTTGGDNPALCIRDYLLSPVYGCNYAGFLNEASFAAGADYCDELVEYEIGEKTVSTSDAATDRVTTATAHGWATGDEVRIAGHTGSTPSLNGDHLITVTTTTTFTLDGVNITVGGTGGTVVRLETLKRFTCNGVVDTGRHTRENIDALLSSCRGQLPWEQGQWRLVIRSDAAPAFPLAIDPSNIIGQWQFRNAGSEERWNLAKASYIDPLDGEYQAAETQWPPLGSNAYLAADNNFQNRLDMALPFTMDELMAQHIAQVTLNEARNGISCQLVCTEQLLQHSVGDRVTVTHPTPGWTEKPFWITAMDIRPDLTIGLSLMEYQPDAYALETMSDRRTFTATDHVAPNNTTGITVLGFGSFTPIASTELWNVVNVATEAYARPVAADTINFYEYVRHMTVADLPQGRVITSLEARTYGGTVGGANPTRSIILSARPITGGNVTDLATLILTGGSDAWVISVAGVTPGLPHLVDWDTYYYDVHVGLSAHSSTPDNARFQWARVIWQ
jgi:hypothetical protein